MKIHEYVKKGNIEKVTRLINRGVDINCVDKDLYTPLMIAVMNEDANLDMVSLLVENGADINAVENEFQNTVLGLAVKAGNLEKIRFLLDAGVDINYRRPHGYFIILDAMFGEGITYENNLITILKLLIERGAEVNGESDYGESPLKVASRYGRFNVVKLLLAAGADEQQLQWTELMYAIVFGAVEEVKILLEEGADIYHVDCWYRNPFFLSLDVGNLEKAKLILSFSPSRDDSYFWYESPLFYPIKYNNYQLLEWLIIEGFDVEETDKYENIPLIVAAEYGATDCVGVLLEAGADASRINNYKSNAISEATNLEIVKMLVAVGEDLSDINDDMRVLLRGVGNQEFQLQEIEIKDKSQKLPRFGTSNPELIKNEFWSAMIRSGVDAYFGRRNDDELNSPLWCYGRFGRTITMLADGRIVEIAGEHEDFYDPDFYIYNDVVVFDGKGNFQIYGYPQDVFPPTDFHTATLVDNYIYIIGSMAYQNQRIPTETPVYRLNCDTFQIEWVETSGENPGWICQHKAKYQPPSQIYITGGEKWKIVDDKTNYIDNCVDYILDLTNFEWSRVNG